VLRRAGLGLWLSLCALAPAAWAADASSLSAALNSITADELKQHVSVLADDTLEGREAGSRGGQAAGNYIGLQYRELKLRGGAADGNYYQAFNGSCRNILGVLEGSDPELKNEVIVIGAHYDHVGRGSRKTSLGQIGLIHHGADDNASGTAGVLELAQACTLLSPAPKRTILFAMWDSEEQGLYGSKHWLANPTIPLSRVVLAFNTDMIGRLRKDQIEVLGSRSAPGLRRFVSQANAGSPLNIDFTWEMKENSDHYPFFDKGIPVLMPFTGLHEDYHKPSDEVEKINPAGMREVARLLFSMVIEAADAPTLPKFRPAARYETPERRRYVEQTLPDLPARLGVTWEEPQPDVPGLVVQMVTGGSAAANAGVQVGDRLLTFNGHEIPNGEIFRQWLLISREPIELGLIRGKDTAPKSVTVKLAGIPIRYGFYWRVDDAEPGCVILHRVVQFGPADVAGLKPNDRILQINGADFPDEKTFGERVRGSGQSLDLTFERNGRVQTTTLHLFQLPQ